MKKALLFSLTLFFIVGCNKDDDGAINIYGEDVTLRTQKEVNEFGSKGYTHVEGKLCIGCVEQNDINDLGPLRALKKVNTLSIQNNTVLIDLNGLENLTELDNLMISKNPLLENLDSFNGLTAINTIEIDDNGSLRDINGLYNLTAIREGIKFRDTRVIDLNLENVSVLGNFESTDSRFETITIGATKVGSFTLNNCYSLTQLNIANIEEMDHFYFINNNELTNLNLENLHKVNDTLSIVGNQALTSLNVDNLTSLGALNIYNTKLTNLDFGSLQTSSEPSTIIISSNQNLSNINLNNISKSSGVYFLNNPLLLNIQLDELTVVEGEFNIGGCHKITSISLNNLTQLNGDSRIYFNQLLEVIEANNLIQTGNFTVDDNLQLTSLSLPNLSRTKNFTLSKLVNLYSLNLESLLEAEDIEVSENTNLTSLSVPNLSSLKSLTLHKSKLSALNLQGLQNRVEPTSFFINENPFLNSTNFGAMTIAKDVRFEDNSGLTDLPLSNLTKIEESLYVKRCNNITDINIDNITEVNGFLFIFENSSLETFTANNMNQVGAIDISGTNGSFFAINMNNLGVVKGKLRLSYFNVYSDFTNLDGFASLYNVEGVLEITNNLSITDFCGITNLITNGSVGTYRVYNNAYNPTQQNIIDGNCSI